MKTIVKIIVGIIVIDLLWTMSKMITDIDNNMEYNIIPAQGYIQEEEPDYELLFEEFNKPRIDTVLATKYNPVPEQCWGDPLETADQSRIDTMLLQEHRLRWIAVSRDLREHYQYGDTVIIVSDNPRLNGEWTVRDTMNSRWTKRIDFLVPLEDDYEFHKPIKLVMINKKSIGNYSYTLSFFISSEPPGSKIYYYPTYLSFRQG